MSTRREWFKKGIIGTMVAGLCWFIPKAKAKNIETPTKTIKKVGRAVSKSTWRPGDEPLWVTSLKLDDFRITLPDGPSILMRNVWLAKQKNGTCRIDGLLVGPNADVLAFLDWRKQFGQIMRYVTLDYPMRFITNYGDSERAVMRYVKAGHVGAVYCPDGEWPSTCPVCFTGEDLEIIVKHKPGENTNISIPFSRLPEAWYPAI